jgi:hypothetical protein
VGSLTWVHTQLKKRFQIAIPVLRWICQWTLGDRRTETDPVHLLFNLMRQWIVASNTSLTHENISKTRPLDANLVSRHNSVNVLNQVYFKGDPRSAVCVQLSFDSRNSAIHNAYRILRRPSSLFEPRHPSLKVVRNFFTMNSDQDW